MELVRYPQSELGIGSGDNQNTNNFRAEIGVQHAPPNSGEKKASHEDPAELKMEDRIGAEAAVASRYVCDTTH